MKAHVLFGIGDLRYVDVPEPVLRPGEVLVHVCAAGICGSDVERVFRTGTYRFPTIIGHEFAGEVCRVYDTSLSRWLGKRCGIFPLKPCFRCDNCQCGEYELCTEYDYLGSRCDGGFAEYVAVPAWNIVELPDTVDFPTAAMLEPAAVAMHALCRSECREGDTLAVVGSGPIGMILCRLALLSGAKMAILVGRTQAKLDLAGRYGIESLCNSETEDVRETIFQMTGGHGVDIAVEGTGASGPMNLCLDIVRRSGCVVALGNPSDEMRLSRDSYWKVLRRQLRIIGTWNSRFGTPGDDWSKILTLLSAGKLTLRPLITHWLPFDCLMEGLKIMQDKSACSNKVMLVKE